MNAVTAQLGQKVTLLGERTRNLYMFSRDFKIGAALLVSVCLAWAQASRIDPKFAIGSGFNGAVHSAALQDDGKIVVTGFFSSFNGIEKPALARLNPNGSPDGMFLPPDGLSYPETAALDSLGRITVAASGGLKRFLPNGNRDSSFSSPNDNAIWAGINSERGIFYSSSRRLWKLFADGSVNPSFYPPYVYDWDYGIYTGVFKANGNVVVAGGFSYIRTRANNYYRAGIAELDQFGEISTNSFVRGVDAGIAALIMQPDGRLLAGGDFTGSITRYSENGEVDPTFAPSYVAAWDGFNGVISAIALQSDGKIIIGGQFVSVGGIVTPNIARLLSDGTVDLTFDPGEGPNGSVRTILVQPDGRVVVGGEFGSWDGVAAGGIVRLLGDAPVLDVQRAKDGEIITSWPAAYTNFILQSNSPIADSNWVNVLMQPATISDICYVTNNSISGSQFFRLSKQ